MKAIIVFCVFSIKGYFQVNERKSITKCLKNLYDLLKKMLLDGLLIL